MVSVTQWLGLARQVNRLYWDSTYVIAERSRQFANGQMTSDEWHRMCAEKPVAFMSAMNSGADEWLRGGSPACVAHRAMAPIGARADHNARRLRDDR